MRKPEEIQSAFSPTSSLDGLNSFFLVGIGGAGMSALARMLKVRGFKIRGSDSTASPETARLQAEGIEVAIGHSAEAITEGDRPEALILTDAIDLAVSPEVAAGHQLGIPMVRRSQALGWVLKPYKVIAVTGTHGKTTTTGMLGAGLVEAGLDPLVVVGASIPQWGGPVREGKGEYAVVEACEAYDSFHDLQPSLVLLTNLELDHVDFHGSYENLRASVVRFVNSMPADGCLVYCGEDAGACEVAQLSARPSRGYTLADFGRLHGTDPNQAMTSGRQAGRHNALNRAGAVVLAEQMGLNGPQVSNGALEFGGAERRQQRLLFAGHDYRFTREADASRSVIGRGYTVIDDYAHHPTEIRESLLAIRLASGVDAGVGKKISVSTTGEKSDATGSPWERSKRLIVVFQPHLYSRTAPLIKEFAEALSIADEVYITDIYPAREAPMAGVSSARIAELIDRPVHYIPNRHLLAREVARRTQPGDCIVGMGAGNISEFAPAVIQELTRRAELGWLPVEMPLEQKAPVRVMVLFGGDSAEREVSLHSGIAVSGALKSLGYDVTLVDASELLLSKGDLSKWIGPQRPDVAFLAVHGTHAEDGAIQGLLELLHIPYTGSGIQASALAMDKGLTKKILIAEGIRVPKGVLLDSPDQPFSIQTPLIVKPNAQGSTVGLSFVETGGDVCGAIRKGFAYDERVLVEEWIVGTEISTPVLNGEALLPVEIRPVTGRYDFESKYAPGATEEVVPAQIDEELLKEAQALALKAHRALGCSGATRTDALVRGNEIFVLEVNTLPGMTNTSLLPNSAAACGISFPELCKRILEDALERHAAKQ